MNINALKTLLSNVSTEDQLIAEYEKRCPIVLQPLLQGETERDSLDYC